jgi:hypothetical protein
MATVRAGSSVRPADTGTTAPSTDVVVMMASEVPVALRVEKASATAC